MRVLTEEALAKLFAMHELRYGDLARIYSSNQELLAVGLLGERTAKDMRVLTLDDQGVWSMSLYNLRRVGSIRKHRVNLTAAHDGSPLCDLWLATAELFPEQFKAGCGAPTCAECQHVLLESAGGQPPALVESVLRCLSVAFEPHTLARCYKALGAMDEPGHARLLLARTMLERKAFTDLAQLILDHADDAVPYKDGYRDIADLYCFGDIHPSLRRELAEAMLRLYESGGKHNMHQEMRTLRAWLAQSSL